ncbi:Alpha-pyrone synthesis polyketide synthase-like Pks11 [Neolecta irregularis DAH-3]|uniref:Alpha-pyrone synthesis polyketide synthase-like Pks11 n=1 Tax=Neolecta irregularis (strain DAH-3) TaxID=1198029 RepID=A0A1U7LIX0_NEOID|nr:Alpha-pyrone synthesis polyketide synthase-like Pks11 [Neolecta irregularis DAH-3]|eukprot:OLL22594.1 Alpha-pyrone synthesis polyketide synthase-like Pks11 [Neolecta irregularis DAH-3]
MQYTAGGCVFGMTGYARAHDHLRLNPGGACLVVAVEVNSGMFMGGVQKVCREAAKRQYDGFAGHFRGQLLTTALFGDLVSASLLVGPDHRLRSSPSQNLIPALIDHRNLTVPDTTDHVGMEMFDEGYMGYLTTKLIKSAPQAIADCAQSLLKSHGLQRSDIKHWVIHPGGPAILRAVAKLMDLSDSDVAIAQEVYSEIGNVAACTAIEIMKRTIERKADEAEEGDYILGLAAGYGVIAQGCLFRWEKKGTGIMTPNSTLEEVVTLSIQGLE